MSYTFVHDGKGFTPDGEAYDIARQEADKRNRAMSAQEVEDFKSNAPSPYFAYQSHDVTIGHLRRHDLLSTWMGDKLATVVHVGSPFRSSFGDRRQNFRALSIDGETVYSGTAYLSAGDYVRMRKVKP
jgi:tRNA(His) 5'-end guanylyltransferase